MKHLFITLLILCLAATQTAMAQQSENTQKSLYLELLGPSNIVGLNFDSRLKPDSPWGYRVGMGYTYSKNYGLLSGSNSIRGVDVPIEANYLLGKKRSKFELGLGVNLGYYKEEYDVWNLNKVGEEDGLIYYESVYAGKESHSLWGYYCFGNIGYRYQPSHGFQFRVGISPSFNLGGKHAVSKSVFPYISFGYVF
ncbi:hypothetical protein [Prevotella sp. RM4]|uniref:hypothetical protein n=1 Tax=Prevotella sp. RM4 TaxID=1200547 RepID=UPI00051C16BC|nr:hypothetical protein [Prevotella sp. RM4]